MFESTRDISFFAATTTTTTFIASKDTETDLWRKPMAANVRLYAVLSISGDKTPLSKSKSLGTPAY